MRNRRTGGGIPWSNDGVAYQSPALTPAELAAFNAGVPRATNDAAATEYLRRSYEPRGRTDTKVLTLHALDDGLVLPQNQEKYREAFDTVGRADQLVQLYTPTGGHCGFSIAEHVATLRALFAWVEEGATPERCGRAGGVQRRWRRSWADPAASRAPIPASGASASSSAGRRG